MRSVRSGASAATSLAMLPSRIRTCMPFFSFSRPPRSRCSRGRCGSRPRDSRSDRSRAPAARGRRRAQPANARSLSSTASSLASTPGKFIISARPSTAGWSRRPTRSAASSRAPEVSRWVAGTHELSCTLKRHAQAQSRVEEIAEPRDARARSRSRAGRRSRWWCRAAAPPARTRTASPGCSRRGRGCR